MTTTQTTPEKRVVAVQIPLEWRNELVRRAVEAERTLSAELREAIRDHVARTEEEETS